MLRGALPLFRFAGIQVYLHFTWFIFAILAFQLSNRYHSPVWAIAEYLAIFAIVLIHEFGHALACRQVGGIADKIMLWPLGGAAFVSPPPRPGAYLWSIAAGPLVNVILLPVFSVLMAAAAHLTPTNLDAYRFIGTIAYINCALLLFNLLPIYPLDGGQILRGLLWYGLGRIRSLRVASTIGVIGAVGLGLGALAKGNWWLVILAFFIFSQAQMAWRQSRLLQLEEENARRIPVPPTADPRVSGVEPPPLP